MATTYIDSEQLSAIAASLQSKGENLLNAYKQDCSSALQLGNECIQMTGVSTKDFFNALDSIYTRINERLQELAEFLKNNVSLEYEQLAHVIENNFNGSLGQELSSILGISVRKSGSAPSPAPAPATPPAQKPTKPVTSSGVTGTPGASPSTRPVTSSGVTGTPGASPSTRPVTSSGVTGTPGASPSTRPVTSSGVTGTPGASPSTRPATPTPTVTSNSIATAPHNNSNNVTIFRPTPPAQTPATNSGVAGTPGGHQFQNKIYQMM